MTPKLFIADDGEVHEPGFHDAELTGVMLLEGRIEVHLRTSRGLSYRLRLDGVRSFFLSDMTQQNIIMALYVVTGRRLHRGLGRLHQPPHPAAPQEYHKAYHEERERLLDDVASGELTFCWIDAAAGASFEGLCASVMLDAIYEA